MTKNNTKYDRPNVSVVLWWDWDYEKTNFRKTHIAVIERIIEKGTKKEWEEMVNFYGLGLVIHDLKNEIWYLTDQAIEEACDYFSLQKEEMKCYNFKRSRPNYWL